MPTFLEYIEKGLNLLEDRILHLGTGYTHHWYISAGRALLRLTLSPEQVVMESVQAVERVSTQYYRVMASQVDMELAKEKIIILPDQRSLFDRDMEAFFGDPEVWVFDSLYPMESM
ncbi:hypothetical protein N7493_009658 [Penicillium malachiteum]|uniref:Uncharacterized protein n=1 Tax=Penicillium malachiteum TaxID=1324776 RepID=A0AAD6HEK4_9EURO|nr:hypothetical protein N7493_009658 [Penicillium malachiteum]